VQLYVLGLVDHAHPAPPIGWQAAPVEMVAILVVKALESELQCDKSSDQI
jgi:hypothetical protein